MKKLVLVFLFVCNYCLGFAKELESKTFLVLFDEAELEMLQTDMGSIAEQLNPFFPTKSCKKYLFFKGRDNATSAHHCAPRDFGFEIAPNSA